MKSIITSCVFALMLAACSMFNKPTFVEPSRSVQILPGLTISTQHFDDFAAKKVEGGGPAIIIEADGDSYFVSKTNSQEAFLDLPAKMNISDALFLNSLFEMSNKDYDKYRPSFFINDETSLLKMQVSDCGKAYIIVNAEVTKTKAYLLLGERLVYSIHPLSEKFYMQPIIQSFQLSDCGNNKVF